MSMRAANILSALTPARVDWLGADGRVMRSFKAPPGGQAHFVAISG